MVTRKHCSVPIFDGSSRACAPTRSTAMRTPYRLLAYAAALAALGAATFASASPFVEGKHYTRLPTEASVKAPEGKIEVREFFWYGCPHCYTLEPYIHDWEKPEFVEFVLTPAVLGKTWVDHAHAFYALKTLGRLEELHPVLFDALHAKNRRLRTLDQMANFFEAHGIEAGKFKDAAKSFVVKTQVSKAEKLGKKYDITSVPTFTINGEYLTSPSMVGDYKTFFEVVDFLVRKARG